jgi:hypothetical protein
MRSSIWKGVNAMNKRDNLGGAGLPNSELAAKVPPVLAADARARSLVCAMIGAVESDDMHTMMRKQVEKARGGHMPSTRFIWDVVHAAAGGGQPAVQQAIVVNGHAEVAPGLPPVPGAEMLETERRENVARVLAAAGGPKPAAYLVEKLKLPFDQVAGALIDHPWFAKVPGGWTITDEALTWLLPPRPALEQKAANAPQSKRKGA